MSEVASVAPFLRQEFIDHGDTFSLTFFPKDFHKTPLKYLGSVSGRDENKIAAAHLGIDYADGLSLIHIYQKNLGFGKYMTDYMFVMDWTKEDGWIDARIVPHEPISLDPALSLIHI